MSAIIFEAPVFTLEAALQAAKFGVHRIELCSNFPDGGETPSAGMLKFLKKEIDIPIMVMIRPRGGDFVYSSKEIVVMKNDIDLMGDLGADGFVFGVLEDSGKVNKEACESLSRTASGKTCTFHRAFDASSDLRRSLEDIISLGFDRILTSGGKNSVTEGLTMIKDLMQHADRRISIMPGGGTKPEHVGELRQLGFLKEIHASCKTWTPSLNQFINPMLSFSDNPYTFSHRLAIDQQVVNQFLEVVRK
jgi:copper homeostasis protein